MKDNVLLSKFIIQIIFFGITYITFSMTINDRTFKVMINIFIFEHCTLFELNIIVTLYNVFFRLQITLYSS